MGAKYVNDINHGVDSDQDFIGIIVLNQRIKSLERYIKSLSLPNECDCNADESVTSCLTEDQVLFIIEQIHGVCGGCSCNC
jgi:hypothetical protein